jgi:hypothetical protein
MRGRREEEEGEPFLSSNADFGGEMACIEAFAKCPSTHCTFEPKQWQSQDQNLPMAKLLLVIMDIVIKFI